MWSIKASSYFNEEVNEKREMKNKEREKKNSILKDNQTTFTRNNHVKMEIASKIKEF